MTRYRTIVADPPWPIGDMPAWFREDRQSARERAIGTNPRPYPVMTIDEIAALPVSDLAERDTRPDRLGSTLFLWTISEHIENAYRIARAWNFKPGALLVWCKPHRPGGLGGTFRSNTEYILYARRGAPELRASIPTRWFSWPVTEHSRKPDAFLDLVERISPGPYLELFARRQRLGWDTWGDEALEHVTMADAPQGAAAHARGVPESGAA